MASQLLRTVFTNPVSRDFLPGNTLYCDVSDRTISRWLRAGYVERRGLIILTRKGYHAAPGKR